MSNLGQLGVSVDLDLTKLESSTASLNRKMREIDSSMRATSSAFAKGENSSKKLGMELDGLNKKYEVQKQKVDVARQKYEELVRTKGKDNAETQRAAIEYNKAVEQMNRLGHEIDEVKSALSGGGIAGKLERSFDSLGKHLEGVSDRIKKVGEDYIALGKTLTTRLTLPIVATGSLAIKQGMEFDDSTKQVTAVTGSNKKQEKKLVDTARKYGRDTKFTSSEVMEAMYYMGLAGWNTGQITSGIGGVLDLSSASGEDLSTVSDIVTDGMGAFQMEAKESTRMADVMASASANSNTNVSQMGHAMTYAATTAGTLGFNIEDTSIALGLMANVGIKGSKAGTSLKTSLQNLSAPSKRAQNAMDDLGISILDSEGKMKSLDEIMAHLREKFAVLTQDEKVLYASYIFGKEASPGMLAIINAQQEEYDSLKKAVYSSDGKAKEMAEIMEDTLGGDVRKLKSALESVLYDLYEVMEEDLRKIVNLVIDAVKWFGELPEETKRIVVIVAGLLAIVGPILVVVGNVLLLVSSAIRGFSKIAKVGKLVTGAFGKRGVLGVLGLLSKGFTRFIPVIGGLLLAFDLFMLVLRAFGVDTDKLLGDIWEKIKKFASDIWKGTEEMLGKSWEDIKEFFAELIELIIGVSKLIWVTVKSSFKELWDFVVELLAYIWRTVKSSFKALWDFIVGILIYIKDFIKGVVDGVVGYFVWMYEGLVKFGKDLWNLIVEIFGNITQSIKDFFSSIKLKFVEAVTAINEFFNGIIQGVVLFFLEIYKKAEEFFLGLVGSVRRFKDKVIITIKLLVDGFKNHMSEMYNTVKGWTSEFVMGIVVKFSEFGSRVKEIVSGMATSMRNKIKGVYNSISEFFGKMVSVGTEKVNKMVDIVKSLPGKIKDALVKGASKVGEGIKYLGNTMIDLLANVINGVIGGMNKVLGLVGIKTKVPKWEGIPQFSKGTGGHKGGLMTVGEHGVGNSSLGKTRELVVFPDGNMSLFNKETTISAPAGTEVLNNRQTESLLKGDYYSRGTFGGGFMNKGKEFLSSIGKKLSNGLDLISKPSKLINNMMEGSLEEFSSLKGFSYDLAKGLIGRIKEGFKSFMTKKNESLEGGYDGGALLKGGHRINYGFGTYNLGFNGNKHYGVDTSHVYDPVHAPMGGKVTRNFQDYGGGKSIEILSKIGGEKIYQWFMHLSKSLVGAGNLVKAGQRIAISGNTGAFTTGPHLHYQIMKGTPSNATAINPLAYLRSINKKKSGNGGGAGKFGYYTGGLIRDAGYYMLGERGEEAVIPLNDKGVAVNMLNYLNERLGNDGRRNRRANDIPKVSGGADSEGYALMREQNGMLKEMLEGMRYMLEAKDEEINRLKEVAENTNRRLTLNPKEVAKELDPIYKRDSELKGNNRGRYRR